MSFVLAIDQGTTSSRAMILALTALVVDGQASAAATT